MKLFQAYYLLIFLSLRVASQELSNYAKPGCNDTCGNVRIPYPFGIGVNCAVNEWYSVECSDATSKPYIFLGSIRGFPTYSTVFQIVGISLENQTISVNILKAIYSCQNNTGTMTQNSTIDFGGSPFLLSAPDNIFVFDGCGNATLMDTNGSTIVTNCFTTTCQKSEKKNCSLGISCCQTRIHRYLQSYVTSFTIDSQKKSACRSAFVMDTSLYNNQKYYKDIQGKRVAPISLLWTLSEDDYENVSCSCGLGRAKLRVPVGDGTTSVDSWRCRAYSSFSGNPYLQDGCQETSVTQYTNHACSKRCKGMCYDDNTIYNINGSVYEDRHYCYEPKSQHSISVVLV